MVAGGSPLSGGILQRMTDIYNARKVNYNGSLALPVVFNPYLQRMEIM